MLATIREKIFNPVLFAKTIIVLIPIFLFLWIFNQNFFITRTLTYHFKPNTKGGNITLGERNNLVASYNKNNQLEWRLDTDSLKFSVKIPRSFEQAKLKLNLNNVSQNSVTLSAQSPENIPASPYLADYYFLNTLPWSQVTDGTLTLWQREVGSGVKDQNSNTNELRQYKSIAEFESNLPPLSTIGVVNLDPEGFINIPDYKPTKEKITIPHFFRGSHDMTFYAKNEPIDIQFEKFDLNRKHNEDTLKYSLIFKNSTIASGTIGDDGTIGGGRLSRAMPVNIYIPNASPGIYHLDIKSTEDVIFGNISTTQHYFTFENSVFLADGPAYFNSPTFQPITLSVLPGQLDFNPAHEFGLQTILINKKKFNLPTIKEKRGIEVREPTSFVVSHGDLSIQGSSIVIEPAKRFPLEVPISLPLATQPDAREINYIIAPYQPRETYGPLSISKSYELTELFVKSKTLYFSLNAPGLMNTRSILKVNDIEVKLTRGPLPLGKILNMIKKPFVNIWK